MAEFTYLEIRNAQGEIARRPILSVTLTYRGTSIQANGLLDTGADVNVLPYSIRIALGGVWDHARTGLQLSGNLAHYEARGILIACTVGQLPSVQLAFAWTRAEDVPLIFGQVNFFSEFDVCFFKARNIFDVTSKVT
jgi:hypothetical protein